MTITNSTAMSILIYVPWYIGFPYMSIYWMYIHIHFLGWSCWVLKLCTCSVLVKTVTYIYKVIVPIHSPTRRDESSSCFTSLATLLLALIFTSAILIVKSKYSDFFCLLIFFRATKRICYINQNKDLLFISLHLESLKNNSSKCFLDWNVAYCLKGKILLQIQWNHIH